MMGTGRRRARPLYIALIAIMLLFTMFPVYSGTLAGAFADEPEAGTSSPGGAADPGDSGDPDDSGDSGNPGDPGEPEATPELAAAIYLKNDEPAADGKKHFVGEDFDSKYKTLAITVKGKTIQLNGYYTTNKSDGVMYETADSSSPLGPLLLSWSSSDNAVATVSPDGLITAVADGEVTINATISDATSEESKYEGAAPLKSVKIKISGQTAEYVKKVTVIDEAGKSLSSKDDAQTVISGANKFFSFYALITWHDPNTGINRTEDTRTDTVTSTITWTVGGSSVIGQINKDTGRFKSTEYSGNCFVQASVTGGVDGKAVKDIARVQVDTGVYTYQPANSLTLKVVYREFPDKVVQEHTYSLSQLSAKLTSATNTYTVLGGSRYGTIRATGYLFKDVLALEGVDIGDVYQYRFTTADGYDNPITQKLLYGSGARYYFPNWDISSRAGAVVVPPVLAYSSNLIWGESEVDPTAPLDDATRFRLVFGPLWGGEANSSFQIYYIGAVTIVLDGAPPADNGKGKGNDSGDGDDGGGKDKPGKQPPGSDGGDGSG
ncbi:MAG: Ig-like domain-containing protein, partial [Clostridiales Family XIII bacterium]|nr:Ig-like domain-containing protein [Clostridiales Family XIII bacterium]